MSATGPAIRLRQACAHIGESTVLHEIDLQIAHGERIAIMGNNGAGKSTLLKLLAGTVPASSGDVDVLGCDLRQRLSAGARRRLHARTGQVFQGLHLVGRLTVLENVLLGCLARNRSLRTWARLFPAFETARAQELLGCVGLAGRGLERADRLSGGERQKVAIARMLLQHPQLILADEPTSALDPVASIDMVRMLSSRAQAEGATLITVVHEPNLLKAIADRVIGLSGGRMAFDLPVAGVTQAVLGALYGRSVSANAMPAHGNDQLSNGERT